MDIDNEKISAALINIADALEEQNDNIYRIRAYRKAALSIKKYPTNLQQMVLQEIDLTVIPQVGNHLSSLIKKMILTNDLNWLPASKPAEIFPSRLINKSSKSKGFKIYTVINSAERLFEQIQNIEEVERTEFAGDYRRKKELIKELIILIVTPNAKNVFDKIITFSAVKYYLFQEETCLLQLHSGLRVKIKAVPKDEYNMGLFFETGSVEHIEALQFYANEENIQLADHTHQYDCESEIYQHLKLDFIPPELRENRGEILAAKNHDLPQLVELHDIKGDLHCHTHETDGLYSLEEMVNAAIEMGYEYVAITDHSQSLKITNGMDEKRLLKQIKLIDKLNAKYSHFTILKSMEIDILEDGRLDLSNDMLKELDLTVCSIHSKFRISKELQTERILRAMDNPYFNILGHATGRLINSRIPYEIDMDKVLNAAKERNCIIEVNAQPARLDINDIYCKMAKEKGVKIAISSDAHTLLGFNYMILGVNQARRGWMEAKDIINTYSLKNLRKIIKRV